MGCRIVAVTVLALSAAIASRAADLPRKPNVIVIFSDDHGWADLGANGVRTDVKTPHLDALAKEGVRFSRGYVTAPQCVPSRAGLLTGRYQQRFGVDDNLLGPLPKGERTIAHYLADAGYACGMVGKWHLDLRMEKPEAKGAARQPRRLPEHLPHKFGFQETFCGELNNYHATHDLAGKPVVGGLQLIQDRDFRVDVQTRAALSFIDRHAGEPFFLYLAYFAPHVPGEAPPKYLDRFRDVRDEKRRVGLAMISAMDDGVGAIRERLAKHGVADDTLIVFIGDNGAPTRPAAWNGSLNDPLVGEKGMVTDGGVRVPFVAAWPRGLPKGRVYDEAVSALDVIPTALAAAGREVKPEWKLDGVNLLPYVNGAAQGPPHARLFWRWRSQAAVLEGKWKLVYLAPDSWRLFDTTKPEGEKADRDLAAVHPDKVAELKKKLLAWDGELKSPGLPGDLHPQDREFFNAHVAGTRKAPAPPGRPESPKPMAEGEKPFVSRLVTRWGEKVTPESAWTEYPRPLLVRDQWTNLNGRWDYAVSPRGQAGFPAGPAGSILVPFCLESRLGGVQRLLKADEALWYRRTFRAGPADRRRTLLHFEAVDYRCEVFVNGKSVGTHVGGHTPFSFDATAALKEGENELTVRVEDETEGWQLRGKQTLKPRGIWYTQVSGIWQTVWLETVPERYVADLKIATDAARGTIRVRPVVGGKGQAGGVKVVVREGTKPVAEGIGPADGVMLEVPDARPWTPDTPFLYDLEVTLLDHQKRPLETVKSYAGIRTVGKTRDAQGHLRFTLNGQEIFHWGPLDQGWWPDGLLTPPSDAAMKSDLEFLKAAGFNMVRKHIKVEPRRYYSHCDRLGLMVWQDQVSGGPNPKWTRLQPDPKDADWPDEHHTQWLVEFERMIDALENHPSIVMWVPFNEAWGQHRTTEVGKWALRRDPTRLVNIASGGNFWPVGDVVDAHKYPHPDFPFDEKRDRDFVKVMGEFGGHGWPVAGHVWDANRKNWGYGDLPKTLEECRERYARSIEMLTDLRARGIAAGVYTQTSDVEGEVNGLLTYDRRVAKIEAAYLARLHKPLLAPPAARPTPGGHGPGGKPSVGIIPDAPDRTPKGTLTWRVLVP